MYLRLLGLGLVSAIENSFAPAVVDDVIENSGGAARETGLSLLAELLRHVQRRFVLAAYDRPG